MMEKQFQELIRLGKKAEADYPKASNLWQARVMMLNASEALHSLRPTPAQHEQTLRICQRILTSSAPKHLKDRPDFLLTKQAIILPSGQAAKNADNQIRAFLGRHPEEEIAAEMAKEMAKEVPKERAMERARERAKEVRMRVTIYALHLSHEAKLEKLKDELVAKVEPKLAARPDVLRQLVDVGRGPKFQAVLRKLDDAELRLPDDLLGKVVVIDFWATWCPPCIKSLPKMKRLYGRYKDEGVEFVGISLDRAHTGARLAEFVKTRKLNWIHTYSGKYWLDPAARRYDVRGIPSIWVIGKDGRIISYDAHDRLEALIQKALKAPRPTTQRHEAGRPRQTRPP